MAETVKVYEAMYILDVTRYGRNPDGVTGTITKMVEDLGGEMLVARLWDERRLAYPIEGQRKGAYWLTYFKMATGDIQKLERAAQLNENVLRSLVLSIDPRIVDALVEHARAGHVGPRAETDDKTKGQTDDKTKGETDDKAKGQTDDKAKDESTATTETVAAVEEAAPKTDE